jgi:hypothetical protein
MQHAELYDLVIYMHDIQTPTYGSTLQLAAHPQTLVTKQQHIDPPRP